MSSKRPKPEALTLQVPRPTDGKAQLRDLGGCNSDSWNSSLSNYLARALPTSSETFAKGSQESEKIAAKGSANAVAASGNETPCFRRFDSALLSSHSNSIIIA